MSGTGGTQTLHDALAAVVFSDPTTAQAQVKQLLAAHGVGDLRDLVILPMAGARAQMEASQAPVVCSNAIVHIRQRRLAGLEPTTGWLRQTRVLVPCRGPEYRQRAAVPVVWLRRTILDCGAQLGLPRLPPKHARRQRDHSTRANALALAAQLNA
jgi:hypothetical protein